MKRSMTAFSGRATDRRVGVQELPLRAEVLAVGARVLRAVVGAQLDALGGRRRAERRHEPRFDGSQHRRPVLVLGDLDHGGVVAAVDGRHQRRCRRVGSTRWSSPSRCGWARERPHARAASHRARDRERGPSRSHASSSRRDDATPEPFAPQRRPPPCVRSTPQPCLVRVPRGLRVSTTSAAVWRGCLGSVITLPPSGAAVPPCWRRPSA